jgi:hypothetical protein
VIFSFSTSDAIADAFQSGMLINAGLVSAMTVIAALISISEPIPLIRLKAILVLGIIAFGCIGVFTYSGTYGNFISAEVDKSGVQLKYVGPFGGQVDLPREEIETVLFGLPGKTLHSCYIRIQQKSGKSNKSVTQYVNAEVCKSMRIQMLSILAK